MALVVGSVVLRTAVPSLVKLLKYEWGLDKKVKNGLTNLEAELRSMEAFLDDVSSMSRDQQPARQLKVWADEVRELWCAIEKRLHSFMARIELTKGTLLSAASKLKINHEIASYIKETRIKIKEVRERYGPYPLKSSLESTSTREVDPRMFAMYTTESNPVGITGAIEELTKKLSKGDHVSIVGMGGMGKTTLAQSVYNKMKGEFDCWGFVPIGQRADMKKVLTYIFDELRLEIHGHEPNESQLTEQLQNYLVAKRCLIVVDDIWDEGTWNSVERVFKGSVGSKIITTTRNLKVAEEIGGVYQIKPLSPDNSKRLLRIKAQAKNNDNDFDVLSDKILRKCGGIPIAITMIGSLLAKNQSKEWHRVYDSIGFDEHKEDGAFEHIRMVFYYSYNALPYNIKKCFLYLHLFPEDHWIEKNMLIWRWIAEGLVPDFSEQTRGLFEIGEAYFNELLDRSMVQWAVNARDLGQGGCRVHSLMLDLIRDLSCNKNENFSAVLGMKHESTSQTRPIHRLAIHGKNVSQIQNTSLEVGEVLSFYANTCPGSAFPSLSRFALLRVIDLEDCDLSVGDCKLKHLGKLDYLEYIGLLGTSLAELPKKIGRLKFLQTLDVRATGIRELPPFVDELRKLKCLRAGKGTRMMGRIGKLTSLEELWLHSADKSPDFAVELRKLSELRVLVIHFDEMDEGLQEALVESLRVLKKLQVLQVWSDTKDTPLVVWEGSVPCPQLRQLLLFGVILPRPMPWIHHLCAPKLSKLLLHVNVLKVQDLENLGQMPLLRSLYLHREDNYNPLSYTAGRHEFKLLEYLYTNIELVCGDGALPMIQELEVGDIRVGIDVGLRGNMPLLERASYHLNCSGCSPMMIEKAEAAVRQESEAHPNRPALSIKRFNNFNVGWKMENQLTKSLILETQSLRKLEPQANASSLMSTVVCRPVILNTLMGSLAPFLPTIGQPPTLTVGDATDGTGSPSQFADGVLPRRPNGEGQVLLTTRPTEQTTRVTMAVCVPFLLHYIRSPRAVQTFACSSTLIGLFLARAVHSAETEIISMLKKIVDGPGTDSATSARACTAATEELSGTSSEFDDVAGNSNATVAHGVPVEAESSQGGENFSRMFNSKELLLAVQPTPSAGTRSGQPRSVQDNVVTEEGGGE